jgi:hypothetical protein
VVVCRKHVLKSSLIYKTIDNETTVYGFGDPPKNKNRINQYTVGANETEQSAIKTLKIL